MIYLKISDEIRILIEMIKNSFNENILNFLEGSIKFLEILNKRKSVLIQLFSMYKSGNLVKSKLNKLNNYLMIKGFNDNFNNNSNFEEPYDFLEKNEKSYISMILENNNNFKKKKKNIKLREIIPKKLELKNKPIIEVLSIHKPMECSPRLAWKSFRYQQQQHERHQGSHEQSDGSCAWCCRHVLPEARRSDMLD